jgi:hypothetical protein
MFCGNITRNRQGFPGKQEKEECAVSKDDRGKQTLEILLNSDQLNKLVLTGVNLIRGKTSVKIQCSEFNEEDLDALQSLKKKVASIIDELADDADAGDADSEDDDDDDSDDDEYEEGVEDEDEDEEDEDEDLDDELEDAEDSDEEDTEKKGA